MNGNNEKRIIAFTSQSLRQYGIRAVRMDDIAQNMGMSKRTIYQIYTTKENLVHTCLKVYQSRITNMFHIIKYDSPGIIEYLWAISKAYIENLYRAECVFWSDVSRYMEYKYIYDLYNHIWSDELEKIILICQEEKYIIPNLKVPMFIESFTTLLYNARVAECLPTMLHNSAYYMLKGIMTKSGFEQFGSILWEYKN